MATVEMQYYMRECDGEPSWFLLTCSFAMKVAQA